MAGSRKTASRELTLRSPDNPDYEVGYGKPPTRSQFKPGQSGNPLGRPKGAKNKTPALNEERLKAIILEEAYREIAINETGRTVTIPLVQAVIRALAVNAAKGNTRAQQIFTTLLGETEAANKRLHDEWIETAINYKVDWERELERRQRTGVTGPEPLPHPDDIVIDMRTGKVLIKGPMTKEEKVVWDQFRDRKAECEQSIADNEKLLRKNPRHRHREILLKEIANERKLLEIINRALSK